MDEFAAALQYGLIPDVTMTIPDSQNWFYLPRATRATLLAQINIQTISAGITTIDQKPYWDDYAEREARRRGKGRGNK